MKLLVLLLSLFCVAIDASENLRLKMNTDIIPHDLECYIGADIGGTHSRFGFFDVQKDQAPALLFSLHAETKKISNFNDVFADVMAYAKDNYNIVAKHACIAIPGVVTKNTEQASVRGLFDVHKKEIIRQNNLTTAFMVNDLFVAGCGIDLIEQEKIVKVLGRSPEKEAVRGVIGVGTGLGSSTMTWNKDEQSYIPHPGDAGLLEFAPHNQREYDFANHIKQMNDSSTVHWTAFVSGSGIRRIYSMLKLTNEYKDSLKLDAHDPAIIFAHPEDDLCKATISLYSVLLGRFTRNCVCSMLPLGGLYLMGGVVGKNSQIFSTIFEKEYFNCQGRLQNIVQQVPVYVITDPNVGMYGAVQCLLSELKNRQESKK